MKDAKGLYFVANNAVLAPASFAHRRRRKIAQEFNLHSDLMVTADQCLESKQKEVEDNNSKTWKFYAEMGECVGDNPNINPVFIYEVSSSSWTMSGSSSLVRDDHSSQSASEDGGGDGAFFFADFFSYIKDSKK